MYYDTTSAKQSSEISPEHMCGVVVFIYLFHFLLLYIFFLQHKKCYTIGNVSL